MEKNDKEKEQKEHPYLGFDLYPERRPDPNPGLWDKFLRPVKTDLNKRICERKVAEAFEKNPLIKILVGALKNAGCPVDLKRHIVCEDCSSFKIQGGYDPEYNQIVICKNIRKCRKHPEVVLLHELIHMYDNCVNEVDFKNFEHLACTEIRAANLSHCSYLSSVLLGQSSIFNIKKTHQYCVKLKAAQSLAVARKLDFETAAYYVLKVFDKCYNDLEPLGRRLRRNSNDPYLAYEDARHEKCMNKAVSRLYEGQWDFTSVMSEMSFYSLLHLHAAYALQGNFKVARLPEYL